MWINPETYLPVQDLVVLILTFSALALAIWAERILNVKE